MVVHPALFRALTLKRGFKHFEHPAVPQSSALGMTTVLVGKCLEKCDNDTSMSAFSDKNCSCNSLRFKLRNLTGTLSFSGGFVYFQDSGGICNGGRAWIQGG